MYEACVLYFKLRGRPELPYYPTLFAQKKIGWAGYVIQKGSITVDPRRLKAIAEFPLPRDRTDLRSFNGLVEQLAGVSKEIASLREPLRPFLSSCNPFEWTHYHTSAFNAVK